MPHGEINFHVAGKCSFDLYCRADAELRRVRHHEERQCLRLGVKEVTGSNGLLRTHHYFCVGNTLEEVVERELSSHRNGILTEKHGGHLV